MNDPTPQFEDFTATELYCPKCRRAQPVRSRILLALPDGDLHEFLCAVCGESLATRKTSVPIPPVRTDATPLRRRRPPAGSPLRR